MPPITGRNLAAVTRELTRTGWQRSHQRHGKTYYHHAQHPRLAAIAQAMPSGRGKARFIANH